MSTASQLNSKKIFITCQGTRGDVQPYTNLGSYLVTKGWSVTIGAPGEFERFVLSHPGLDFVDIGIAPTILYEKVVQTKGFGKLWKSLQDSKQLFNPSNGAPFAETWFRAILNTCQMLKPDVLVLVFTNLCGAAVIPEMLGLKDQIKVILSYPMPMAPTKEFCVSMAGSGYSYCWSGLNKIQWNMSERFIAQAIHLKAAKKIIQNVATEKGLPIVDIDKSFNAGTAPALFCFSPAILPKPTDWPDNYHVVGQFTNQPPPPQQQQQQQGAVLSSFSSLPEKLQSYLDESKANGYQVVYAGFGSLGFFSPEQIQNLLDSITSAITNLSTKYKIRAVIQTALSSRPGMTAEYKKKDGAVDVPYMMFSETVDHTILFKQVDMVLSHGGVGTLQAALRQGTPCASICCLPTADQSFWADLLERRELGPPWVWIDDVKGKVVEGMIKNVLDNYEKYKGNAERMRIDMAKENGVEEARVILDKLVVG
jgi:sterol 3beta-glucosyltransferase